MTELYIAPLWISLKTVLTATVITFFLGIAAARWMAHYSGKFKSLIDSAFILPMVLPPTVIGFGLLLLFGSQSPLGRFLMNIGANVVFSWPATVISAVVVSFPLMYMTARGAFEQVEPNIEKQPGPLEPLNGGYSGQLPFHWHGRELPQQLYCPYRAHWENSVPPDACRQHPRENYYHTSSYLLCYPGRKYAGGHDTGWHSPDYFLPVTGHHCLC